MEDNAVAVVAIDKGTGFIQTVTSCCTEDSQRYAKYYRGQGYNARVVDYETLDKMLEEEKQYRLKYNWEV